jgi:hypothetical protein
MKWRPCSRSSTACGRLTDGKQWFDPDVSVIYPDRIRRRPPGTTSKGLGAHTDSGALERWLLPAYQQVFANVFNGNIDAYDPWDAAHRTEVEEYTVDNTTKCSVFRTFQGWTALSDMIPVRGCCTWCRSRRRWRMFCCARCWTMCRKMSCAAWRRASAADFREMAPAADQSAQLIPALNAGDSVWWHCDVIHSVAPVENQQGWGNVMYIPAAPMCEKNLAYAQKVKMALENGASPGISRARIMKPLAGSLYRERSQYPRQTGAGHGLIVIQPFLLNGGASFPGVSAVPIPAPPACRSAAASRAARPGASAAAGADAPLPFPAHRADMHRGQRHILNRRQVKAVDAHHRDILRHAQAVLLQGADGARRHKIAADQKRRRQRFACCWSSHSPTSCSVSLALKLAPPADRACRKRRLRAPRLADPRQAQLHGVAAQAQHVHHLPMPHLKQILRRPLADGR